MFQFLYLTELSAYLLFLLVLAVNFVLVDRRRGSKRLEPEDPSLTEPPSPRSIPIIGHLHLLRGYEVPYQAFTALGKKYGSVIKIKLGNVNTIVINGQENIREVLVTKGHHFDSRPDFERYQQLFSGNKENSLAFCNWSDTQKARRDMLRSFTFPRAFTNKFTNLEDLISSEIAKLSSKIAQGTTDIKRLILQSCANIFINHFCSRDFDDADEKFVQMVENFDEIFYEVNQGYAADFLPFLMPLHNKHLARMNALTHNIRSFINESIICNRYENSGEEEPADYVDCLIQYVKQEETPKISWDTALFALEDIIGGHSAVGNFLVKLFGFLVKEQEVQRKIQSEIDNITNEGNGYRSVRISDRSLMPYTEGVIFEAIRLIASPIVPRVASQDSSVNGYRIKKDSLIFLNNYDLSMSEKLWDDPENFKPERFVLNNRFVKPEHFLPFGGGRRSCMGYKMVQFVSFGILTGLLQNYTILPVPNEKYKVPIGSLALPAKTFKFTFSRRKH